MSEILHNNTFSLIETYIKDCSWKDIDNVKKDIKIKIL